MDQDNITDTFEPYTCSLGTVIGYDEDDKVYRIQTSNGQIIGMRSNSVTNEENVENDISNPPIRYATTSEIAAYRWKIETGGVNVTVSTGTHKFDSSRENRVMWVALASIAQSNPSYVQSWKTLNSVFIQLTASDIITIYTTIFNHIALCFEIESELLSNPTNMEGVILAFQSVVQ